MTNFLTYILILFFTFTSSVSACYLPHATIGPGNITVGGETNSDLEGLNRDVERAQEITKDKITGALDGSMTIDNRVFSGEGRKKILKDFKVSESFIENIATNLYDAVMTDVTLNQALSGIRYKEVSKLAISNLLNTNGGEEAVAILSGQIDATVEEKDIALAMFKNEIAGIYNTGKDETDDDYIKIGNVKTFAGMELGVNDNTNKVVGVITGGSHDKDTHDIYLNDLYINGNTEKGLEVFGHEVGHAIYGSDEDFVKYLGNNFTGAYTDGLWINGQDTSLGNWSVDNNSSYVIGNTMDWSKVENRDNLEPVTITFVGGVIIAAVGAYKGGEAKAIADVGYIGNGEYMRPSGEHISSEDLETNLKIYGTMDIGGNLLMGIAPFVKGIKGGIRGLFKGDANDFKYSSSVLSKIGKGDNHDFPILIDKLLKPKDWVKFTGGDNNIYYKAIIEGTKNGNKGFFEYVLDPRNNTITHRLFKEANKITKNLR